MLPIRRMDIKFQGMRATRLRQGETSPSTDWKGAICSFSLQMENGRTPSMPAFMSAAGKCSIRRCSAGEQKLHRFRERNTRKNYAQQLGFGKGEGEKCEKKFYKSNS